MHPLTQDFLNNFNRIFYPQELDQDNCVVMVSSFQRSDEALPITVLSLAEGFGMGWMAEEACQIALQALRNEFVKAEIQAIDEILAVGMAAANRAVYERACSFEGDGEIGVWMLAAVIAGNQCYVMQAGRGAVYMVRHDGRVDQVTPSMVVSQESFLGMEPELSLPFGASVPTVPAHPGDTLLFLNGTLGDALFEEQIRSTLARFETKRAVDRLVKLGRTQLGHQARNTKDFVTQEHPIALGALGVEIPGGERKAAKAPARYGWMAMVATGALVLVIALIWAIFGFQRPPATAPIKVTLAATATNELVDQPTAEIFSLPTRISTVSPIPLESPTLANTATRVIPSATSEPTAVPTSTPSPPPPTRESTPTPTMTIQLQPTPTQEIASAPTIAEQEATQEPTQEPTLTPTPLSYLITLLEPIQDDDFKRGDKIRFKWEVEYPLEADKVTFKLHVCSENGPCYDFTTFGPIWNEFELPVNDLLNELSGEKFYWGVVAYQDQIEISRSNPAASRIFVIVERPKKEPGDSTGPETPTPRP
ncbi:MAG: hypothetical protein JXA42_13265 [Anaerolineales bacterium]|nr:hypothetical protein [Anaerolineales bacterium]